MYISFEPDIINEEQILSKTPIRKAHNMSAREKISQLITKNSNPKYKKYKERIGLQSHKLENLEDLYWSVRHSL